MALLTLAVLATLGSTVLGHGVLASSRSTVLEHAHHYVGVYVGDADDGTAAAIIAAYEPVFADYDLKPLNEQDWALSTGVTLRLTSSFGTLNKDNMTMRFRALVVPDGIDAELCYNDTSALVMTGTRFGVR